MRSRWIWAWRAIAVAAVAAAAGFIWWLWDHQPILAWLGGANPWLFFSAMAILPALGAPLTPFFIAAGATFGGSVGLVGSLAATAINVAGCYWIARSGLRRVLEPLLRRTRHQLPDFETRERGATRFTVAVKLAPGLPAFLKSYVLGVAAVPFLVYFVVSMLITGAYAVSFVLIGKSLLRHDVLWAIVPVAIVAMLAFAIRRIARRRRA